MRLLTGKAQGKRLGRPKGGIPLERLATVAHLPLSKGAVTLGVSFSTLKRWRLAQKSLAALS
jgi:hypothetical protein